MDNRQKGFTLIELLVTIAIIGILAVIGLVLYNQIPGRAKDSIRKSQLKEISVALELYNQQKGSYVQNIMSCSDTDTQNFYSNSDLQAKMSDNTIPTDPTSSNIRYCYISDVKGSFFRLYAKLDNSLDFQALNCSGVYYYSLTSDNITAACP